MLSSFLSRFFSFPPIVTFCLLWFCLFLFKIKSRDRARTSGMLHKIKQNLSLRLLNLVVEVACANGFYCDRVCEVD